jgi:hypothetical protein
MSKIEDFTPGSVFTDDKYVFHFHSIDPKNGLPLLTCKEYQPEGTIGFLDVWRTFKKVN